MQFIVFFVLSLIAAAIHLFRDRQPRTASHVAEVLLLWLLVINVGVGGVFGFIGHTVFADRAAASIGWPAGNPFQTEVGIANLAFGVVGTLCYWFRDQFWLATIIVTSVFQLGAAVGHIRQIIVANNWSPNNAGPALWADIAFPIILVALLVIARRPARERAARRRLRHQSS
jgi:cell shape-determining protein MreD